MASSQRFPDPSRSEPGATRMERSESSGRREAPGSEEPEARALFRAFDGLPTGTCVFDREGRCVFANAAAERMLERPAGYLVGRHYLDHEPSAPGDEFDRAFRAVVADGVTRGIAVVHARKGRDYEIEMANGGAWIFVLWRDVSAQRFVENERERLFAAEREARAAAEEASRAKDAFLATVSHELRTPLSAMLGWARMLRDGLLRPDRTAHALAAIERNALAQAQIVEDLLDISRIVAGKLRLEVAEIDLAPVLDAAVDCVRPALSAKRIRFEQRVDPAAGAVLGDAARLQQVVWNLLANAVKFAPAGGRVDLSLERAGMEIVITVSDDGPGIPADLVPRLFARFQQADMTTTRAHGGLGLGLAISRHLVELHGGVISAAGGPGATFAVRLPLAPERSSVSPPRSSPRAAPPLPHGELPDLDGLRVLVVDDQPDVLDLVVTILATCGAHVTAVSSAVEARAALRRGLPDVVLCDISMPEEDGYAFITWLRALPKPDGGRLPCGAFTAYTNTEDRRRILDNGYNLHVPKPLNPDEIVHAVQSLARMAHAVG
ncbi:MAG: ATP-binding protein [Minicystis sp.]